MCNIDTLVATKGQPPKGSDFELESSHNHRFLSLSFGAGQKKEIPFFFRCRGKFVDFHLRFVQEELHPMFRNIPFSSSTFPKILGHHTTYWWILAHVWRSICWTYVPRPQLTGGWTKCFIGYFSWIEEVPLWWEIGMHSSKKTGASPDVAEISINQYVRMMNQSHQPCQCTNEYRFLRINVLSLGNLLYNLGLDHILLESPIYIYIISYRYTYI